VILQLRLTLSTTQDLYDILGCVHETFRPNEHEGHFHIRQTDTCWQGVGAEELVRAVRDWCERVQSRRVQATPSF